MGMQLGNIRKIGWSRGLIIISFLPILGFIFYINIHGLTDGYIVYFEAFPLALVPLVGGLTAIYKVWKRKLWRSALGFAVTAFGLGLIFWGLGTLVWGLYNVLLDVAVPYPSLADIGYAITPMLWFVGIYFLYKATGTKYQLRSVWGKVVLIFVPLLVLLLTAYVVFYKFYGGIFTTDGNVLELLLLVYYPVSDIFLLSPALVITALAWKNLGGSLRKPILVVLGALVFMYLADMAFAYTFSNDKYYNGNWVDLLWAVALFLLGLSINSILLPSATHRKLLLPLQCEDIFTQLALKIIKEEEKIIGSKAWELASEVNGLYVDENRTFRIQGNKNEVINQLIAQYEQIFGQTSRELAKDVIKGLSTVANTLAIDAMVTLNVNSAMFFVRQASTGNFQSIFPFEAPKQNIDRHHPLIYYFLNHRELILKSAIPELIQRTQTIAEANDLKEIDLQLTNHHSALAGGIYSDQELIGVLMLGSKASGDLNSGDLEYISKLLSSSSGELAQIVHYRDTQAAVLRGRVA